MHEASPVESPWKICEEHHIAEDVGFALPNPLVREGTELWQKYCLIIT